MSNFFNQDHLQTPSSFKNFTLDNNPSPSSFNDMIPNFSNVTQRRNKHISQNKTQTQKPKSPEPTTILFSQQTTKSVFNNQNYKTACKMNNSKYDKQRTAFKLGIYPREIQKPIGGIFTEPDRYQGVGKVGENQYFGPNPNYIFATFKNDPRHMLFRSEEEDDIVEEPEGQFMFSAPDSDWESFSTPLKFVEVQHPPLYTDFAVSPWAQSDEEDN